MSAHVEEGPALGAAANPGLELLAILNRRRWTILSVFVVVTLVVALGAARQPVLFQAESSLIVRVGREYIYRPEVGQNDTARAPSLSEMVNSEVEILSSHDLAEQVVQDLGVETLYPELQELEPDPEVARDKAVVKFSQACNSRPVLDSSVIKVSYEHEDPQVAADAVNLLVEHFKTKHVEVFGEVPFGFLEEQQAKRRDDLARAEEALAVFKKESGVVDLGEQRILLLGLRVRLDEDLRATEVELAAHPAGAKATDATGGPDLPAYLRPEMEGELLQELHRLMGEQRALAFQPRDAAVERASVRLLELRSEEKDLLRDFVPENRKVQAVRAEIAQVQAFLTESEQRTGAAAETRRQFLESEVARVNGELAALVVRREQEERRALVARRDAFRGRMLQVDKDIDGLDRQEKTLRQLERDLAEAERALDVYRGRVEDSRITEELDREKRINVRVIQRASRPVEPVGLSLKMKCALGAMVGVLMGAASAVLLELFRSR